MKFSLSQFLVVCLFFSIANAEDVHGQEILSKRITINLQNRNLRDILSQIEKKADVKFLFHSQLVSANDQITIHAKNQTLSSILEQLLSSRKINFEADGNQIILTKKDDEKLDLGSVATPPKVLIANAIVVEGVVVDDGGQPMPGVNVIEKATSNGTTTDREGKYKLVLTSENSTISVSFIGYISQEIEVGTQTVINVALKPNITSLTEVLVVGYGTQKKGDVITSISTVSGADLNLRSTPNFESSLQGLAAGVNVQSSSGAPGAPVKILIRGANSLNLSTDPLYIIDGMPISSGSTGLGSSNLSPMSLINSSDIENIQVLKDAGATAIYGSRASNGVVLVTTKSAKKNDSFIQLNYSTGFSSLTRTPADVGYANSSQWFQAMDLAYQNSPTSNRPFKMSDYYTNVPLATLPISSPQLSRGQADSTNTNWGKKLFSVGRFQNFNISAAQGSDHTSFYVSGNYYKNDGVQDNVKLERFAIRTNIDFKPSKNLTISPKLTFSYTKNDQRNSGITSISVDALPWFPVYEPANPSRYYNAYSQSNPAALSDPNNILNQVEQFRALGGLSFDEKISFVRGLSLKGSFSGDVQQSNKVLWQSRDIRSGSDANGNIIPQAAATQEIVTFNSLNYNAYVDYSTVVNQSSIAFTGGIEATRSFQNLSTASGTNLTGNFQELGLPGTVSGVSGQKGYERYLLGYFGRAGYKFKERYIFGLSARRDGSSVFIAQNRWGTFLGASAGWILSEEGFMSFLNGNTFLKLRGSYGEIGNQFLPSGLNSSLYNSAPNPTISYGGPDIQGVNGTIPINIPVNNLKWETTRSSDVGLDFGLFNNRLNGSFAYYHRYVSNMLLQAGLPYSAGVSSSQNLQNGNGAYDRVSSIWGNFGGMVNSGYEIELHSINYDQGGLKWTTDFNIGFNKQIIKRLSPDIDNSGSGLTNVFGNQVSKTGSRRGVWFIADFAGVDPITGVSKIYARDQNAYSKDGSTKHLRDANGKEVLLDATNKNVQANQFYQDGKSGDPRYQGGVTNTFFYKGFELSAMISFQGGNYILDYDRQQSTVPYPTHAILNEVYEKSWKVPGDVVQYPKLIANNPNFSGQLAYSNNFLYKGDFVRFRTIQIAYSLPIPLLQKINLKAAKLYVSGSNLFTKTKYPGFDPETAAVGYPANNGSPATPGFVYYSAAIPQLKTITLGVDIKF
jgi:TonB-dependent starch-binding outer membrane protein SusC